MQLEGLVDVDDEPVPPHGVEEEFAVPDAAVLREDAELSPDAGAAVLFVTGWSLVAAVICL